MGVYPILSSANPKNPDSDNEGLRGGPGFSYRLTRFLRSALLPTETSA